MWWHATLIPELSEQSWPAVIKNGRCRITWRLFYQTAADSETYSEVGPLRHSDCDCAYKMGLNKKTNTYIPTYFWVLSHGRVVHNLCTGCLSLVVLYEHLVNCHRYINSDKAISSSFLTNFIVKGCFLYFDQIINLSHLRYYLE